MKNTKFYNETYFEFEEQFEVGFTTVPNFILNDTRLSYKALGIYVQILQYKFTGKHKIYLNTLSMYRTDGKTSVAAGMDELDRYGYITRVQLRNEKGHYRGVKYIVRSKPTPVENTPSHPSSENQLSDNPNYESTLLINKIGLKENKKKENIDVDDAPSKLDQLKKLFMTYKIQKRLMPQMINLLSSYVDKLDLEVWEEIFVQASEDSVAKKYNYIKTLLEEFTAAKVKTKNDLDVYNKNYKEKTKKKPVNNKPAKKNRFDNFNSNRTAGYTEEELEDTIRKSQESKVKTKDSDIEQPMSAGEIFEQAQKDIEFWNSLPDERKVMICNYAKLKKQFMPRYMSDFIDKKE